MSQEPREENATQIQRFDFVSSYGKFGAYLFFANCKIVSCMSYYSQNIVFYWLNAMENQFICTRNDYIYEYGCNRYYLPIFRSFFFCYSSSSHSKSILSLVTGNFPLSLERERESERGSEKTGRLLMVASCHSFYLLLLLFFHFKCRFFHIRAENKGRMRLSMPIIALWPFILIFFLFYSRRL